MATDSKKRQVAINWAFETEVFVNQDNGITIKQTDLDGEESFVVFAAANANAVIAAIQSALGEIIESGEVTL